jgi:hypothetical protein
MHLIINQHYSKGGEKKNELHILADIKRDTIPAKDTMSTGEQNHTDLSLKAHPA